MIECKNISKAFDGRKVLDDISLKIKPKEIFAVMGVSGGGKSVLIQMMAGLLQPDSGTILFEKKPIEKMSHEARRQFAKRIGYMFQYGALFDSMHVFDNLALPLREHTQLSYAEIRDKIENILHALDLGPITKKFPHELSGGMLKRVGLARAMILEPELVFCDEPCSGLDPVRKKRVYDLIKKIRDQFGTTMIVVTHDAESVPLFADRAGLIVNGQVETIETDWKKVSQVYREFTNGSDRFLEEANS